MSKFINFWKLIAVIFIACFTYSSPSFSAKKVQFKSSFTYSGKGITLVGELSIPNKKGSHPVVILLHGCSGLRGVVKQSLRRHASSLNQNGFATLILDSFGPRKNSGGWVCDKVSRLASARAYRARDTLDTIKYLKTRNDIDTRNIFVMGRSNGASTASGLSKRAENIRAIVAYYPWCGVVPKNPEIPLLVLSGAEDDWTPPARCQSIDKPGGKLSVIVYPKAVHSFDLDIPVSTYKGHKVGENPAARRKSSAQMIKFFKKHLKR